MADGPWPDELDLSRPNGARVYDYLLGGAHNFQVDRDHAARLLAANPEQQVDRKSTRLNSSHSGESRMPSSA